MISRHPYTLTKLKVWSYATFFPIHCSMQKLAECILKKMDWYVNNKLFGYMWSKCANILLCVCKISTVE